MNKSNIKSLVIIGLMLVVCSGAALAYSGSGKMVCEDGANCTFMEAMNEMIGGVTFGIERFPNGLIASGDVQSYAYSANATLTADQLCGVKILKVTPGDDAITLTLPTSSSLINSCLQEVGSDWTVRYSNEDTVAATTTTLAITSSDTMELLEHDGGDVVIPGAEDAIINFMNFDGSTVKATVISVRAAD